MRKIRRFFVRLKRTIEFLPLIWKGADWDFRFAVDLFMYQLDRTADHIESRNRHESAMSDANRIRTATDLLKKVYEEDYYFDYMNILEAKYGPSKFEFVELEKVDENGEPLYKMVEVFEKDYTDSELLEIAEERQQLIRAAVANQNRAHSLAWKWIEHNIRRWWD